MTRRRVIVGMSGGVDSSVAAASLMEQGYDVVGLFMKNWEEDDEDGYCAAEVDLADAQQVCDTLGIRLHTVNFAHEYWERVFTEFLAECRAGRTPNPDVLCNREIKFKEFLHWSERLGADLIATGHYVRRTWANWKQQLKKGLDSSKDQSYFLYSLDQRALRKCLFPIGEMTKAEVRAEAELFGFANHDKKGSTGICFIGERKFKSFLSRYLPPNPGEIHTIDGRLLGRHDGLMYFTIGQRQGLGIGGPGEPWYVAGKDLNQNILHVVQGHDHPALFKRFVIARDAHWIAGDQEASKRCVAKTRYRQADQSCHIVNGNDALYIEFDQPQRAITPGQSIVFYDGDICLGGAIIAGAGDRELAAAAA